ncbi:MAG: cytochrome P450 [Acidimicrobiales bacterium]
MADGTLDDDEIRDQVVTLMGAGYDTTAASLAWTVWELSRRPDLRQGCEEADAVLGPLSTPPRADTDSLAGLGFSPTGDA